MRFMLVFALSALGSVFVSPVSSASAQSVARFGDDVHIAAGTTVDDVATMGGDVTVEGNVDGDVATMGGDVSIRGRVEGDVASMGGDVRVSGVVEGDVVSAGGEVTVEPGGRIEGEIVDHRGSFAPHQGFAFHVNGHEPSFLEKLESGVASFAAKSASFLFLLLIALGFHTLGRERFETTQVALVKQPARTFLIGLLAHVGAVVGIVLAVISLIGIPAAIAGGISLAIASHLGLAAVAGVVGALLPIDDLRERDVLRIACGVGVLFGVSMIPYAGAVALFVAACWGLGALIDTRIGKRPVPEGDGPFRTAAPPSGEMI